MTSSNENVTPDAGADEEEVLATPATPGAEALPLPDGEVDKPSQG